MTLPTPAEEGPVFRTAFKNLLPWWLTSGEGEKLNYSLMVLCDAFAERARQAMFARWPSYCPEDALAYHGRDRKITRGIEESAESFRARLLEWWGAHKTRGNPFTLLEQLRAYCNTTVRVRTVDRRGNWYTIDRDGTRSVSLNSGNWNWDDLPASRWSRFWVIIYPDAGDPWAQNTGDISTWPVETDLATTIGTTATIGQAAAIRGIIRDWQPDGTRCEWIIIAFDDASFNPASPEPGGTWRLWGDGGAPSRLATADYWSGVNHGRRGDPP